MTMPSVEFVFDGMDKPVSLSMIEAADLVDDPKKMKQFLKTNIKKGKENASKPSKVERSDS